jgi:hypothetical protein
MRFKNVLTCECVNTLVGGLLYHEMQAQKYGKSDDSMKNNIGKSDNIRIFAVGKSDNIMLKRKIDSYLDNFFTHSKQAQQESLQAVPK